MKAMILAAGLGTRLRPLTDHCPKALVKIGDRTLLEIVLSRLRFFGIHEVIVNVHHLAGLIVDYLQANRNFGMRIEVSREDVLLDTGGGLKRAAYFFLQDGSRTEEPFVLHNVDVISTIDLRRMAQFHQAKNALATLAVQERASSRCLLFDEQLRLCGRRAGGNQPPELVRAVGKARRRAFCGIHVISPRMLSMIEEDGVFPIIPTYLRLAARGEKILAFPAEEYFWRDLGKPESLKAAEHDPALLS